MEPLTNTQRCDDLASKLREIRIEVEELQEEAALNVVVKPNLDPILYKFEDMKFIT